MARPKKNSADYFSHDKDMRNDRKIKALRSKFGMQGYGVWCMLLEHLTGSSNNEMPWNDLEIELVAGDFGVSVTEMVDILNYCEMLKLIVRENDTIYSISLKERLAPVYAKRERAKRSYRQKAKETEVSDNRNNNKNRVSVTEMTQSKVKESKVKESNIDTNVSKSIDEQSTQANLNYEEIINFFNTKTNGVFGLVRYPISDKRKGMLRARIREHGKQAFAEVVLKAASSEFLKGNNSRGFQATFDWIIKPNNFQKTLEGNYDNRENLKYETNERDHATAKRHSEIAELTRVAIEEEERNNSNLW